MRSLKLVLTLLVLLVISLSCSLPELSFLQGQPTPAGDVRPKFINHPAPALSIDLKPFQDAGCKPDPENKLRCPPNLPPFDQVGCYDISAASPLLGGLKPAYPLMLCTLEPQPGNELDPDTYLYRAGCLSPIYTRLVIIKDGKPQAIRNMEDLRTAYEPIETPEEALAYAMAATGFDALFGMKDTNQRYLVPSIEDTRVDKVDGGWEVQLYSFQTCGCGPHAMSRRQVNLTTGGDVNLNDPQPVWEDPSMDGLCVD